MKNKGIGKGIAAGIASAVLLGFTPIFGKLSIFYGFSPLFIVSFRSGLASIFLFLLLFIFRREYLYIYPIGLIGCFIAGFINGIGSIFYYTGLSYIDASVGQLLYSFYPLLVAFWLFLDRQPFTRISLLRLILSLPGVYLLLTNAQQEVNWMGSLFMLIAAALYSLHLIINQRVLFDAPAPTVAFYSLVSMTLTVLVVFLILDHQLLVSPIAWWPLVMLGSITFLSRVTLFLGIKHVGGLQTAMLGLGELLITVFVANFWLGERLTPPQILGGVMLGLSMLLVGFDRPTPEKRRNTGLLAWLNPPSVSPTDYPWQSQN